MNHSLSRVILIGGVLAWSACRPKDTMIPVDFETLDPNSRAPSDTSQAPRWGNIQPRRLASKASVLILDEPGAARLHLRLLVATDPTQRAATTMVVGYTALHVLRKRLELARGRVRIEFGADRLEISISGSAADSQEIIDALEDTFERAPSGRQFAATRGRLLGELPRPDTTAFAVAGAASAVLGRPLDTQLVSPEWLKKPEPDELAASWERTFSPDRALLIVHTDVSRAELDPSLKKFASAWPRKVAFATLFRGMNDVIDIFRGSHRRERDRKTKASVGEAVGQIVRVEPPLGDLKGRPTLVIARTVALESDQDRALARLTQRHLQSTIDARLSIEGSKGLWLYRLSLDPKRPAASLIREVARVEDQVQRLPQRWELEQAASLWLGARLVEASLNGEDWTGLASEALSLSDTDDDIASSLSRDAVLMGEVSPEALHEFAVAHVLPSRDDPAWRWVVVGVDTQTLQDMNTPAPP